VTLEPVRGRSGWGVQVELGGMWLSQAGPIRAALSGGPIGGRSAAYAEVERVDGGLRGVGAVALGPGAVLEVTDEWRVEGDEIRVERRGVVRGDADGGFMSSLALRMEGAWTDVEPFAPGVAYGDAQRVPARALGGLHARRAGVRWVLVREDRLTAPVFAVRRRDGRWLAVLHADPAAATIVADGAEPDGGETLIDERLGFASLGGVEAAEGLELGAWLPGSEGEMTYSAGGLPLLQLARWRRRYHPIRDGFEQTCRLVFRAGSSATFQRDVWRWAWDAFAPAAAPVDPEPVVEACTAVLVEQAIGAGIPLEADAVVERRDGLSSQAVMGFVGANTDCGYVLLRTGHEELGAAILDRFATIGLDPPEGEGFDLVTGALTTYREFHGRPAVYARSVAEGALAALRAWDRDPWPAWRRWARAAGDWLVGAQTPDGGLPRAWEAGTGAVLDDSRSASYVVVPFLVALARATGDDAYLGAAARAGEHAWRFAQAAGGYSGATLDNPDVVDKEAAVLSLEAFLDLHDATGDGVWLERAVDAASVAETWIYIWDVPMPVDAGDGDLEWKHGASTVGSQLIATGVSMTDGFLAVNAAAFARLHVLTGDPHFLDVARLVTHGTKAMLALPGRAFDLRGPGWQQEHWCFAVRRGHGLNRRWLPWVAVAHVLGILRLRDLGPEIAELVLDRR
jgi:hypothetical protein